MFSSKTKNYFIIFCSLILLTSCHFSRVYNDDKADVADGTTFLKDFYSDLKNHNEIHMVAKMSDSLLNKVGKDKYLEFLHYADTTAGKLLKYHIDQLITKRIEKENTVQVYYKAAITGNYEKTTTHESVTLTRLPGEDIKVYGYYVNFDQLATK